MIQWATLDQEIQRVTLKLKLYMETGIFHSATEVSAWADGQHCWLCVKVILLKKQNKRNVSTLQPKYIFIYERGNSVFPSTVYNWRMFDCLSSERGLNQEPTKKLLSFDGWHIPKIYYWRAPRYCIWQIWAVARFRCEPGPRAARARRGLIT